MVNNISNCLDVNELKICYALYNVVMFNYMSLKFYKVLPVSKQLGTV